GGITGKNLVFEKYLFSNIYNVPEIDGFARRVEFTYPDDVTIRIVNSFDDSDVAIFDKETDLEKIITYVSAFQKPRFEEMYEKSNFPQNAIIEETPNVLYLYPELCHGPWVNSQTQFVYGLCRFGDSQLVSREWETDNYEIATIDETGVLTAYQPGSVNVTLKCTDQRGNIYEASEVINITEEDFIETGIAEADKKQDVYSGGVYNLQGIRVGDNLNGLPKGIYISGGRKVVVQ
ncbi:MAG: Ig-like domain-containing protein, partial [Muribaculaceae bacterium]|nr:Ig-like domain-containing protein [Muribaculaceae bacterium]